MLFNELREKRGLNYGDYAYAEHFEQEGWRHVSRTVNIGALAAGHRRSGSARWSPQNAVFATRGALYFLDRLLEAAASPPERFETARGFLIGYTRLWEQTDQRRLGYAIDELFYGTPDFLEQYRAALAELTPRGGAAPP